MQQNIFYVQNYEEAEKIWKNRCNPGYNTFAIIHLKKRYIFISGLVSKKIRALSDSFPHRSCSLGWARYRWAKQLGTYNCTHCYIHTELGTAPNQEFLTLLLNPRIFFLCSLGIRGLRLGLYFWFGLGLGYIMRCDVTLVCVHEVYNCIRPDLFIPPISSPPKRTTS